MRYPSEGSIRSLNDSDFRASNTMSVTRAHTKNDNTFLDACQKCYIIADT